MCFFEVSKHTGGALCVLPGRPDPYIQPSVFVGLSSTCCSFPRVACSELVVANPLCFFFPALLRFSCRCCARGEGPDLLRQSAGCGRAHRRPQRGAAPERHAKVPRQGSVQVQGQRQKATIYDGNSWPSLLAVAVFLTVGSGAIMPRGRDSKQA